MNYTALICDDSMFMRTMIADILRGADIEVVGEAETGVQAIQEYQRLRPDIVTNRSSTTARSPPTRANR